MLMSIMFYGYEKFTCWVSRYGLYSTLPFASGCVANRCNRQAITPHRALPATKFNALYKPFNCGF
ncbi:hypothetical protein MNBD_GAMMA19-1966 [hydrothermal vent metagenome]|uniref:Uncharacterized protein n=1 Tax=hydrothermal vent metagenome TaxID=652676 RepID=A0A3B1AHD1_9ZZZZ